MNWGSWSAFWDMGGYGLYVWGSYAVALAFMATEVVLLMRRRRSIMDFLARMPRNQYGRIRDEGET
jgi:heme exporter protein D